MPEITPGAYRHFKGGLYEALGLARHSETGEWLVLYKNPEDQYWVRPFNMFFESVEYKGQIVKRFERVLDAEDKSS